ncbi:MAG: hypothetical protein ACHP6I_01980 [Rickettsiales bacterium]
MPLNNIQTYLLLQQTNFLCHALAGRIYKILEKCAAEDKQVEWDYLALIGDILIKSSGTFQCKEADYKEYIKNTCVILGYNESRVTSTTIYKQAMQLRELFKADPAVLISQMCLDPVRFGALPTSPEIKGLLGYKFSLLAHNFRDEYKSKKLTIGIHQFISDELDKVLDCDEVNPGRQQ